MTTVEVVAIAAALGLVAFLYASVGHAGASGYIAVMTLFGLAPAVVKPMALVLNVLVASGGSLQFHRAGHFSFRLFWPFALLAVPCAFLGGYVSLPLPWFQALVGVVLLFSASRLMLHPGTDGETREPHRLAALGSGAGIGLLAGLTGTGGGIFLSPLMLSRRWARTKTVAAVSSVFILLNSLAGLLGSLASTRDLPALALPFAGAVLVSGGLGAYLGSRRFEPSVIKRLLAVVLTIAGAKLLLA